MSNRLTRRKLFTRAARRIAPGGPWPHFDEDGKWCNCVPYQ